jgi:DNA polymerase
MIYFIDFETYYSKTYSLSKMTTEAYIRDPQFEVIGVSVKAGNAPAIWFSGSMQETAEWLAQSELYKHPVCAHNAAFDMAILNWHFGIRPALILDTLSMARPKHGLTVGGSLSALVKHYDLGAKGTEVVDALGKHRADFTEQELTAYGGYCRNDTELCAKLFQIFKPITPVSEIKLIDMLIRMFTEPALRLDAGVLVAHYKDVVAKKRECLESVFTSMAAPIARTMFEQNAASNEATKKILNSNSQFADLLRSFGVDPPTKISATTGKETYAFAKTDEGLKGLLEHEDERVQAVVSARLGTKSTIEETRSLGLMRIAQRGTLPVLYNYYGAHSGRVSGGDKMNLQNFPRGGKLRKAVIAPPGYVLVVGDSAQIEARMNAWWSGQDDLVEAFAQGSDIYSEFASDVYGFPINKKEYPLERHVGKTAILGLGYGMGAEKFQTTLKRGNPSVAFELEQCRDIVKLYRTKYRRIKDNWKTCEQMLFDIALGETHTYGPGGVIHTSEEGIHLPNGMLIRYPGLEQTADEWAYHNRNKKTHIYGAKVVENLIQALARIVVFDQLLELNRQWRCVMTTHDEGVLLVPEVEQEEAVERMEEVMRRAPAWAPGLPIACEVGWARSYGEAK